MAFEQALDILVEQAGKVCRGSGIVDGRLPLFREAIRMEGFSEVGQSVKSRSGRELFSSLEDIEAMEGDLLKGDRSSLAVQCCLILELANSYPLGSRGVGYSRTTFFDHCRSLEEIAQLNSWLGFLTDESDLQEMLAQTILVAVRDYVSHYVPTWREMLLIFKTAVPELDYLLFLQFTEFLADEHYEIPTVAATLLLSFVAEAVRGRGCTAGDIVARRLLALGASPMVSIDDHQSLFETINLEHPSKEPRPWWLNTQEPQLKRVGRGRTALERLMDYEANPNLRLALEKSSFCGSHSKSEHGSDIPKALMSTECSRARELSESHLALLPRSLQLIASRHIPSRR